MNYGALISEALRLTWRNRFLWVFGFFLGGLNFFNLFNNVRNADESGFISLGDAVRNFVSENAILIGVLLLALGLAGILLALVCQGALVDSVAALHRGEERNFSSTLRAGLSNFWRMLGFTLLLLLILLPFMALLIFVVGLPLIRLAVTADSLETTIAATALYILILLVGALLIFVPLGIVSALGVQALVLDREGVFGSFRSGFRLCVRRFRQVLLITGIAFVLSIGASLVLLVVSLVLGLLLSAPALIFFLTEMRTASIVAGVVAAVILLIPYVVASAAVTTFNHAYWTLAYLQLTRGEPGVEQ